jgi:cathepsin L
MRENRQFFVGEEYSLRLGIFLSNQRYINEFNRNPNNKFKLGVNKFASYTPQEYKAMLTRPHSFKKTEPSVEYKQKKDDIPETLDWRTKGVCNEIRDQGMCGSGWAFASTAAMESTYAIQHSDLLSLSPQNILDCTSNCEGCESGSSDAGAIMVLYEQNGMFMLERDYPYEISSYMNCRFDAAKGVGKLVNLTYGIWDENKMAVLCAEVGPLSCEFDASLASFEYYKSGVYDDSGCSAWELCHSLTIVGYGTESGEDYWLVRNSFGTTWGLEGYGMVKRNGGNCGIQTGPFAMIIA